MTDIPAFTSEAVGPGYETDPASVEAGLLHMFGTQAWNWLLEPQRPAEASGVARMMLGKDFASPCCGRCTQVSLRLVPSATGSRGSPHPRWSSKSLRDPLARAAIRRCRCAEQIASHRAVVQPLLR